MTALTLTNADDDALEKLADKESFLADCVLKVIFGFDTGLHISGAPGIAKTFNIIEILNKSAPNNWQQHQGKITPFELVEHEEEFPYSTHLVEDAPTFWDNRDAYGVALESLWYAPNSNQIPMERPITYSSKGHKKRFPFYGGLIFVSNLPLNYKVRDLQGVISRFNVLEYYLKTDEIIAKGKVICMGGFYPPNHPVFLTPQECWEVWEFIIEILSNLKREPDLRILPQGFRDRVFEKMKLSSRPWREVLEGRIRRTYAPIFAFTSATNLPEEKRFAMELQLRTDIDQQEKIRRWTEKYKSTERTWHRRKKEYLRDLGYGDDGKKHD